jgi:hypothetical protein
MNGIPNPWPPHNKESPRLSDELAKSLFRQVDLAGPESLQLSTTRAVPIAGIYSYRYSTTPLDSESVAKLLFSDNFPTIFFQSVEKVVEKYSISSVRVYPVINTLLFANPSH